jgi:uncharacterized protein (DUF2345 family)
MPDADWFDEQFHLVDADGETPLPNRRYRVTASNGQTWEGVSDADGLTERIHTQAAMDLKIDVFASDTSEVVA